MSRLPWERLELAQGREERRVLQQVQRIYQERQHLRFTHATRLQWRPEKAMEAQIERRRGHTKFPQSATRWWQWYSATKCQRANWRDEKLWLWSQLLQLQSELRWYLLALGRRWRVCLRWSKEWTLENHGRTSLSFTQAKLHGIR